VYLFCLQDFVNIHYPLHPADLIHSPTESEPKFQKLIAFFWQFLIVCF